MRRFIHEDLIFTHKALLKIFQESVEWEISQKRPWLVDRGNMTDPSPPTLRINCQPQHRMTEEGIVDSIGIEPAAKKPRTGCKVAEDLDKAPPTGQLNPKPTCCITNC